jgi:predicted 3-demethylubiquinone-9 3-methyltransferase (glyoxalase superfamily)
VPATPRIAPCLWFDDQAEAAARFYVSVFPGSRVSAVTRYGEVGREIHGRPPGSVMTVEFDLQGLPCTALNGGPLFKFTEAISLQVLCDSQGEIDAYWAALSAGGSEGQCGWLKDRWGLSWQVVPRDLESLLGGADQAAIDRVMAALFPMRKLDWAALKRASRG